MSNQNQLKMYIFVRTNMTDLGSATQGKVAAQVAHAANALVHQYQVDDSIGLLDKWHGPRGFGTTVVFQAIKEDLQALERYFQLHWKFRNHVSVIDPSYPMYIPSELCTSEFMSNGITIHDRHKFIAGVKHTLTTRPVNTAFAFFGRRDDLDVLKASGININLL